MKKTIVGSVAAILMLSIVAYALTVGDNTTFSVNLECSGKSYDNDLSDGDATYLFYSYELSSPSGIVDSLPLTATTNNPQLVNVPYTVNEDGTWQLEGNMQFADLTWNGANFVVSDSGICDTEFDNKNVNTLPVCGNGVVESGEQCDDNNLLNEDGCSSTCQNEFCGDNIIQTGLGEQCDGEINCDNNCQILPFISGGIEPIKDSKVAKAQPSYNFGTGRYMIVNDKYTATDRDYLGFDLTGINQVNNAQLEVYVYWAGSGAIGSVIEAWYCANTDFVETTINWNNQPSNWGYSGNHLTGNCVLADTYTITNYVYQGTPETKHIWNLTSEVNDALSNDKKFTVVLRHDKDMYSNNAHFIQYLTRDYSEAPFRPQLVIS